MCYCCTIVKHIRINFCWKVTNITSSRVSPLSFGINLRSVHISLSFKIWNYYLPIPNHSLTSYFLHSHFEIYDILRASCGFCQASGKYYIRGSFLKGNKRYMILILLIYLIKSLFLKYIQ